MHSLFGSQQLLALISHTMYINEIEWNRIISSFSSQYVGTVVVIRGQWDSIMISCKSPYLC